MFPFFQKEFDEAEPICLPTKFFLLTHVVLPGVLLGTLFMGLEWSGLDVGLSRRFYDAINIQWPYREHWLIQMVLHKGGRLVYFMALGVILWLWLLSFKSKRVLRHYRRSLIYLLLASISGPLAVMVLKNHTHIYCPWDLKIFGGAMPYIRWFDAVPDVMPIGHCFPAAHAGSGYAFVSLYYFLLRVRPNFKLHGLFFGLGLGLVYGFTQQMRGAHFLSHDVAAFAICWFLSLLLFWVFFRKQLYWH